MKHEKRTIAFSSFVQLWGACLVILTYSSYFGFQLLDSMRKPEHASTFFSAPAQLPAAIALNLSSLTSSFFNFLLLQLNQYFFPFSSARLPNLWQYNVHDVAVSKQSATAALEWSSSATRCPESAGVPKFGAIHLRTRTSIIHQRHQPRILPIRSV